ncbi:MAG: cytochrome c3 family protein [bacterium]
MMKKFCLLLLPTLILCLCLFFMFSSKIGAQYFPYIGSYSQYNNPISLIYPGNNTLNPLNIINNYNQNLPFLPWLNPSSGSLWSLILQDLYNIGTGTQLSTNLSSIAQGQYQTNSNFYSPYNPSSQIQLTSGLNTYSPSAFSLASIFQTGAAGSISPYGSQPFSNINSISYTPQTSIIPFVNINQGIYPYSNANQGYFPYTNSGLGQPVLNYYGTGVYSGVFATQPYLPNSSYYLPATTGSALDDIRITSLLEAELVLANPDYGMYCWDPPSWINGGYRVGIWCYKIPIRAQSLDKRGRLFDEAPGFTVDPTGESGLMELIDDSISLYRGIITADAPNEYQVTVVVDSASTVAIAKRRNASCDVCHPTPPGHIGVEMTWGNCHECHNLGDKLHRHAYNAYIPVDRCYTCHPAGCLSGSHGQRGIWCTPCHGTLEDAANGRMKISGQLGKPLCGDCHDPIHSEPGGELFVNSSGHGGIWCINCHGATHVELSEPVGLNNCTFCHTVQASIKWMGPNCGLCHGSSVSPHFVKSL